MLSPLAESRFMRHSLAVAASVLLLPALAPAQGLVTPYVPPVATTPVPPTFPPYYPGMVVPSVPWYPGISYPWYDYGYSTFGFGYSIPSTPITPIPAPLASLARPGTDDIDRASAEAAATLTLELPTAADLWVDGVKRDGQPTAKHTLTSKPLKLGSQHKFDLRARWTASGTTYELERTVTVRAGESGKLTAYSGTPVK